MAAALLLARLDAIMVDYSEGEWHFGLDNTVCLANSHPNTPRLFYRAGSVDTRTLAPVNADPKTLHAVVKHSAATQLPLM